MLEIKLWHHGITPPPHVWKYKEKVLKICNFSHIFLSYTSKNFCMCITSLSRDQGHHRLPHVTLPSPSGNMTTPRRTDERWQMLFWKFLTFPKLVVSNMLNHLFSTLATQFQSRSTKWIKCQKDTRKMSIKKMNVTIYAYCISDTLYKMTDVINILYCLPLSSIFWFTLSMILHVLMIWTKHSY